MRENLSQRIADLEAQNRILRNQQRLRELEEENRRLVVEIAEIALEVANSLTLAFIKKKIIKSKKMRLYKNHN